MKTKKSGHSSINVEVAMKMRAMGSSLKTIGIILAAQQSREMPYQGHSVCAAIRKHKKLLREVR